jgi:hypothetical protein
MSIYQWNKDEQKIFTESDYDTVVPFTGYGDNTSFSIEFDFLYGNASGTNVNLIVSYDTRWQQTEGWAIYLENHRLTFLTGTGKGRTAWNKVQTTGAIPNHHWCHASCKLDVENNKISVDVNYTAGNSIYPVGGLVEADMTLGPYVESSANKIIFSSNTIEIWDINTNPYIGLMKNFKIFPLTQNTDTIDWSLFVDVPLNVTEMSVSNLINLIEQYSQDRVWIQQAVARLRIELQEEIDLNNNLKNLSTTDADFLVKKITDFVTNYKDEIINYETELTSIYTQLSNYISENSQYMNNNKIVKDAIANLQANDLGSKINNIKMLINNNVNLLKDNQRWGDTSDRYWKFTN